MEYPPNNSNSKKRKEMPAPGTGVKVVEGTVVQRKKPLGRRIFDTFIGGDPKTALRTVRKDTIIPSLQDMLFQTIKETAWLMIFPNDARRPSRTAQAMGTFGQVAYNKMSQGSGQSIRRDEPRRHITNVERANHDFSNVFISDRMEANDVIERLQHYIDEYGQARVCDFYDAVGITSEFTDDTWGWFDLEGAGVRSSGRDGFYVVLPRPVPLN